MAERIIKWDGRSGKEYKYWIYKIGVSFESIPANYCFAEEPKPNHWRPIYFGETEDISERFDDHNKIGCIREQGATHIPVHKSNRDKEARCAEETDLINKWQPKCND